jgi:hypothetical protein
LFQLPLLEEAYAQLLLLEERIDHEQLTVDTDWWVFIWGTTHFSSQKAYRYLLGYAEIHATFK